MDSLGNIYLNLYISVYKPPENHSLQRTFETARLTYMMLKELMWSLS